MNTRRSRKLENFKLEPEPDPNGEENDVKMETPDPSINLLSDEQKVSKQSKLRRVCAVQVYPEDLDQHSLESIIPRIAGENEPIVPDATNAIVPQCRFCLRRVSHTNLKIILTKHKSKAMAAFRVKIYPNDAYPYACCNCLNLMEILLDFKESVQKAKNLLVSHRTYLESGDWDEPSNVDIMYKVRTLVEQHKKQINSIYERYWEPEQTKRLPKQPDQIPMVVVNEPTDECVTTNIEEESFIEHIPPPEIQIKKPPNDSADENDTDTNEQQTRHEEEEFVLHPTCVLDTAIPEQAVEYPSCAPTIAETPDISNIKQSPDHSSEEDNDADMDYNPNESIGGDIDEEEGDDDDNEETDCNIDIKKYNLTSSSEDEDLKKTNVKIIKKRGRKPGRKSKSSSGEKPKKNAAKKIGGYEIPHRKRCKKGEGYSEKQQLCDLCGQQVTTQTIEGHKNRHLGIKPYTCPAIGCDLTFYSRFNQYVHMKRIHGENGVPTHECNICGKNIRGPVGALKDHIRRHNTTEKKHVCQVCGKGFTLPRYLKQHSIVHSGEFPYKCSYCGKKFNNKWSMRTHEKNIHEKRNHVPTAGEETDASAPPSRDATALDFEIMMPKYI